MICDLKLLTSRLNQKTQFYGIHLEKRKQDWEGRDNSNP